jgi:antitoxin VapB
MSFETIKIEKSSGEQILKLPESFKIDDDKVYLKKVGNAIFIIPFHNPWQIMMDSLDQFSDDFMNERNQANQQIRDYFD